MTVLQLHSEIIKFRHSITAIYMIMNNINLYI